MSWDYKLGKQSKEIESATAKTLCAFMNSEGGTLVIGVDDKAQVIGVEKDFSRLSKPNRDGFEQKLTGLANSTLGKQNATYVHLSWQAVKGKTIAIVSVDKSKRPVYVDFKEGVSSTFEQATLPNHWMCVRQRLTFVTTGLIFERVRRTSTAHPKPPITVTGQGRLRSFCFLNHGRPRF